MRRPSSWLADAWTAWLSTAPVDARTATLPTVKDAVVLAARCLFQLERRADLDVLLASAGRWGLVPGDLPELEAIQLAFGCKAGEYARVVEGCSAWIDGFDRRVAPGYRRLPLSPGPGPVAPG